MFGSLAYSVILYRPINNKGNNMLDLKTNDSGVTVSSKHISDNFKKKHHHVMEAIKSLECSTSFREANYRASSYVSKQNKKLPCYDITRDGFAFLAMGFSGKRSAKWKEKYIIAFNQMESALNGSIEDSPKSMEELNSISKRIENLNEVGSFHGKGLSGYAKTKRLEMKVFKKAVDSAQMALGI